MLDTQNKKIKRVFNVSRARPSDGLKSLSDSEGQLRVKRGISEGAKVPAGFVQVYNLTSFQQSPSSIFTPSSVVMRDSRYRQGRALSFDMDLNGVRKRSKIEILAESRRAASHNFDSRLKFLNSRDFQNMLLTGSSSDLGDAVRRMGIDMDTITPTSAAKVQNVSFVDFGNQGGDGRAKVDRVPTTYRVVDETGKQVGFILAEEHSNQRVVRDKTPFFQYAAPPGLGEVPPFELD